MNLTKKDINDLLCAVEAWRSDKVEFVETSIAESLLALQQGESLTEIKAKVDQKHKAFLRERDETATLLKAKLFALRKLFGNEKSTLTYADLMQ